MKTIAEKGGIMLVEITGIRAPNRFFVVKIDFIKNLVSPVTPDDMPEYGSTSFRATDRGVSAVATRRTLEDATEFYNQLTKEG